MGDEGAKQEGSGGKGQNLVVNAAKNSDLRPEVERKLG